MLRAELLYNCSCLITGSPVQMHSLLMVQTQTCTRQYSGDTVTVVDQTPDIFATWVISFGVCVGRNLWICDIHGSACAIDGSIVCAEIHGYLRNLSGLCVGCKSFHYIVIPRWRRHIILTDWQPPLTSTIDGTE